YNDPRVKAIVIDSGVFDVKKAYKKLAPKCIGIKKVFPCFPQNALEPIDAIANIENKTIKILLMHAKKDAVISYDQALEFVQKCLELGFDAQLIPFDSDQHCKIFKEKPDQYLTVVDQWYKKLK
ncbi:DUF829 domain-containing protein, partial [Candidatus Babeliales bacterium]|nr:DUF829 domain-containing protein [Candidatus Babeliales bacterium]